MEPRWDELAERLCGLTMRELRGIGRRWFNGALGGASTKADVARTMVTQMRSWWRMPEGYGQQRVRNVLADIDKVWRDE